MGYEPAIRLFLDGLVAVLLISAIAAGFLLNRRIEALRKDTARLRQISAGLEKATAHAQSGIETLRSTARETGRQLQDQLNAARKLRDELKLLAGAGAGARKLTTESARPSRAAKLAPRDAPRSRTAPAEPSEAERELLEALRHVR